jgi:hypothetical protein
LDQPKKIGSTFKKVGKKRSIFGDFYKNENRRGSVTVAKMHIFEQAASCKGEGFKRVKLRNEGLKGLEKFEVGKVRSWKSSELEKFEVGKVRSRKSSKLEKFEVGKI